MNPELAAWLRQWDELAGGFRDLLALYASALVVGVPVLVWHTLRGGQR